MSDGAFEHALGGFGDILSDAANAARDVLIARAEIEARERLAKADADLAFARRGISTGGMADSGLGITSIDQTTLLVIAGLVVAAVVALR